MSRTTVTVYYRSDTKAPDEFRDAQADQTNAACFVVREQLNSYGARRSTHIPWDTIDRGVVV